MRSRPRVPSPFTRRRRSFGGEAVSGVPVGSGELGGWWLSVVGFMQKILPLLSFEERPDRQDDEQERRDERGPREGGRELRVHGSSFGRKPASAGAHGQNTSFARPT